RAGRLDQDPPHLVGSQARIAPDRVAGEILELAQRLDPRVPPADEHERERRPSPFHVVADRGEVEPREHVIAQPDGLLDRLEPDPVPGQAGDGEHARPRVGREYDYVVADLHLAAVGDANTRDALAVTEYTPER